MSNKKLIILGSLVAGIGLLSWMGFFTWMYNHNYYVQGAVDAVFGK